MPAPGQEETVRIVALDRDFHVQCYRCEVRPQCVHPARCVLYLAALGSGPPDTGGDLKPVRRSVRRVTLPATFPSRGACVVTDLSAAARR